MVGSEANCCPKINFVYDRSRWRKVQHNKAVPAKNRLLPAFFVRDILPLVHVNSDGYGCEENIYELLL